MTGALQEVEDKLTEMQEDIQRLAEGGPDRAAEMKRVLGNIKILSTRLHAIKTIHQYAGIDPDGATKC